MEANKALQGFLPGLPFLGVRCHSPPMRNRRISVAIALSAIQTLIISFAADRTEPVYNERTLTYWLQENWYGGPEEVRALKAIGTNALPFLIEGIKNPAHPLPGRGDPNWKAEHPNVP